ncbi:hypothetical protein [Amycolatopsis jiangsuensis]|uniref:Uncharacterized protein n=1 Tax=Amycolatopsis jiangsuensis TaxID=1181879 RepID=A0A840J0L8_9PSEU|nr:hypothetical protein [Amycolatopsis jiangsuensis]MBB4687175.1 hypothetical protein [Amycolatopsis jiangsuensis]
MRTERTLLAVVHNATAATRLLDVLPLFAEDPRVQVVFTCPDSSAFTRGTAEYLAGHGIPLVPWTEALDEDFDWALSASYGGDLHELRAPLTVLPHGMGYNKFLETGNGKPVFGLSEQWLMHEGEVIAEHHVLSHPEQLDRLREYCPEAAENAVIAGDSCLDRLREAHGLRESYRQSLGVTGEQKLVLLSSTWGRHSLFGAQPDLPARIARELPLDEFAVVLALHPNIEHGHYPWQLRMWLRDCERAGVLVLPEEDLWQPAAVAADVTVGDHGSVTYYSACLGTPVLLASAPHEAVDPASPVAALLRTAPELTGQNLAVQLGTAAQAAEMAAATALATSVPGQSAALLTELGYRTLGLPPPEQPGSFRALPLPRVQRPEPGAQWVRVHGDEVTRFAAAATTRPAGAQLVVHVDSPDPRLLRRADILLGERFPEPGRWIALTLAEFPHCEWVACPAGPGWLAGSRTGHVVSFTGTDLPQAVPSLLYAREGQGLGLPGRLPFTAGGGEHETQLTVHYG